MCKLKKSLKYRYFSNGHILAQVGRFVIFHKIRLADFISNFKLSKSTKVVIIIMKSILLIYW